MAGGCRDKEVDHAVFVDVDPAEIVGLHRVPLERGIFVGIEPQFA